MAQAPRGYSTLQIALHWGVFGLVLVQLGFPEAIETAFNRRFDGTGGAVTAMVVLHVATGLAVLVLVLWRLWLRVRRGVPPPAPMAPALIRAASYLTHLALYALVTAMPLTGALAWFGHSEIAAELHELGRPLLVIAIVLHALGAAFEHWVMRTDILLRMLGGPRRRPRGDLR